MKEDRIRVSILGDSISTFKGYNPPGYFVYYDEITQEQNGLRNVYDTWWAKVNQYLHAYLCVNDSYSGSMVSGNRFPAIVSERRLNYLGTSTHNPDIILIYIGFNDFGNGVRIQSENPDSVLKNNPMIFEDAYDMMLKALVKNYPNAKIICGTLMRTKIKDHPEWIFPEEFAGTRFEDYNRIIRKVTRENNCLLADVAAKDDRYETLDGSHPTANGHQTIAEAWIDCIRNMGDRGRT